MTTVFGEMDIFGGVFGVPSEVMEGVVTVQKAAKEKLVVGVFIIIFNNLATL